MKTALRKFVWICLALVALILLSVVGVLIFLSSSAASALILAKAKSIVEATPGDHFDYEQGWLDVFSGLHFKKLHLIRHQAGIAAVVDIESLDLVYDFSLFEREFEIADFRVERPVLHIELSPHDEKPEVKKPAASHDELLLHPLVQLALRRLNIHNLDLDFLQVSRAPAAEGAAETRSALHLRGLDVGMTMALLAEHLDASGEVHLEDPEHQPLEISSLAEKNSSHLKTAFSAKWNVSVRRERNQWTYEVLPSVFRAQLSDVSSRSPAMDVLLPTLQVVAKLKMRAKSSRLFSFESSGGNAPGQPAEGIESVESDADLEIGHLIARKKSPLRGTPELIIADIDSQTVKVKAGLAHDLTFSLNALLRRVKAPESLLKPIDVAVTAQGHSARDLSHISLEGQGSIADLPLFAVKAEIEPHAKDDALHAAGNFVLTLNEGLAEFVKAAASLHKTGGLKITTDYDVVRAKDGATDLKFSTLIPEIKLAQLGRPASFKGEGDLHLVTTKPSSGLAEEIKKQMALSGTFDFANVDYGHWRLQTKLDLTQGPRSAVLSSGSTSIEEVEKGTSEKIPVVFTKPFTLAHQVDFDKTKANLELRVEIPHLELKSLGAVDDTVFHVTTHSPDLSGMKDVDFRVSLKQGAIRLEQKSESRDTASFVPKSISGLNVAANGSLREGVRINLEEFKADVDGSAIVVTAQGAANTKTHDAQGKFLLAVQIPDDFPDVAGQKLRGRIEIPARVSVYRSSEISIDGDVGLTNVSVSKPGLEVRGIGGRFPYSERLKWDGKNFHFMSLITQNPFERVDFERVRPLLQGTAPLKINEIAWEGKKYGPFVGFFSLTQNMFSAHQFDLDLGSGHLGGEMFFDLYPANLQFGLLSRLTGLNLGEVLPDKYLKRVPSGDKSVSARSGFVLNLRSGTMDGRIDVTEIGASQLVAMINVLDPAYQDEKMNKVRGLLAYGYPTSVALAFADGYMDMDIGLKVLGLSQEEEIREIPIASLLSNATAPIVKQSEEGPLK